MNRLLLIIGGIAILVILGAGYFFVSNQSGKTEDAMMQNDTTMQPTGLMEPKDAMMESDEAMMGHGTYIPHSDSALTAAANQKRVLFFYANWCPTCRPVDAELGANETKLPDGVTVIRVNYNDPETDAAEKALAAKYGVTYQHTFVLLDANGNEVEKWNGGGLDEIVAMTK